MLPRIVVCGTLWMTLNTFDHIFECEISHFSHIPFWEQGEYYILCFLFYSGIRFWQINTIASNSLENVKSKIMKSILRLGYVRTIYPWISACGIAHPNSCKNPGVHLDVLRFLAQLNNLTIHLVKAESYGTCNVTTGICSGLGKHCFIHSPIMGLL